MSFVDSNLSNSWKKKKKNATNYPEKRAGVAATWEEQQKGKRRGGEGWATRPSNRDPGRAQQNTKTPLPPPPSTLWGGGFWPVPLGHIPSWHNNPHTTLLHCKNDPTPCTKNLKDDRPKVLVFHLAGQIYGKKKQKKTAAVISCEDYFVANSSFASCACDTSDRAHHERVNILWPHMQDVIVHACIPLFFSSKPRIYVYIYMLLAV